MFRLYLEDREDLPDDQFAIKQQDGQLDPLNNEDTHPKPNRDPGASPP
jgi:hypothetical protein